jgi:nickel-dependent lactate racemase
VTQGEGIMEHYLNYEGGRIPFSLPSGWRVISADEDRPPAPIITDVQAEVRRALDNPIGSPRVEELAKPGVETVLVFDDQQRPTPAYLALPEIMNRLNEAGVPDERISGVCATGTHPAPTEEQLRAKVGDEVFSRLRGRITAHDCRSPENVIIGRTHRGGVIEINKAVAFADLIIGIGECMPHPAAGFGGGYKIVMPGVSSYRSVAEHHFAFMRHKNTTVNIMDGNPFWEEIVDAGRLSRLAFKLDFVMDGQGQVIKAFAGHPEAEQREAARLVESLFVVEMSGFSDITITSASPLEVGVQATKALSMAACCTRTGGTIVWVASQKQAGPIVPLIEEMARPATANEIHRDFVKGLIPGRLESFGISFVMQVVSFKELSEKYNIIHVTEGLTPEQVRMMGMTHSADLQTAIDNLARETPAGSVALFPSGGSAIPKVRGQL